MAITEKTIEINKIYEKCQKAFKHSSVLSNEIFKTEDENEKEFFILLNNYFNETRNQKLLEKETIEIHKIYEECKNVFQPTFKLSKEIFNIKDKKEQEFFVVVSELFLQIKQRELIAKGVF